MNLLTIGIATAGDRVYLDVTSSGARKINFAVPLFQDKNFSQQRQPLGRELSDILSKSLEFHGIISIVPVDKYGGGQAADWKRVGADYVALGDYSVSGDAINLEVRLMDASTGETLMGKSYSGTMQQKEKIIFKFCDSVIESLTGKPGIATSQIAFVNRDGNVKEVFLTDILGKNLRQVTRHKYLTVSPKFVPGGPYLSYTSYHNGTQALYITDLRQDKTTQAISRRSGLNMGPAWSSDGEKMVLTMSKDGNPDLYLLDRKGEIIEKLTEHAGINTSPAWSPDGANLVFVSDRSGKPQLFLMDMRTRKVKRLSFEGTENAEPNWSPTENMIVYSSLRDGVYQLFMVNPLTGEEPKQLTSDPSHHESPCWSPDGNQIIFVKRDGQRQQLYVIMKNGSFERRLANLPGSQTFPQWSR
jgi:TolB protein